MSILVTGGAELIGSNFRLTESNEQVICLDNGTGAGSAESLQNLNGDYRHVFVQRLQKEGVQT